MMSTGRRDTTVRETPAQEEYEFSITPLFWALASGAVIWTVLTLGFTKRESWINTDRVAIIDVDGMCSEQARAWHGSGVMKKACIETEQAAYDDLRRRWDDLPRDLKTMCLLKTHKVGQTYSELQRCINTEQDAFRTMPRFKPEPESR
jgi:hypothetical protein